MLGASLDSTHIHALQNCTAGFTTCRSMGPRSLPQTFLYLLYVSLPAEIKDPSKGEVSRMLLK